MWLLMLWKTKVCNLYVRRTNSLRSTKKAQEFETIMVFRTLGSRYINVYLKMS